MIQEMLNIEKSQELIDDACLVHIVDMFGLNLPT